MPISKLFLGWKGIGLIIELRPKIQKILKMFEPITLPTAMSVFFLKAATAEVASSGREVPIATIVRPIKDWETPNKAAMAMAPLTIHCPPKVRPTKPKRIRPMDFGKL